MIQVDWRYVLHSLQPRNGLAAHWRSLNIAAGAGISAMLTAGRKSDTPCNQTFEYFSCKCSLKSWYNSKCPLELLESLQHTL
jgi:hypothetical protein